MTKPDFKIRPMLPKDIPDAMKLSEAEGWNQTQKDWKLFVDSPANICLLAESENKIVGTTTAINYDHRVAWIGMVLVAKEYRRHGISKSLLTNILKRLEGCKSLKLDATPEGQRVYKQFDFNDEYFITRMVNPSVKQLPEDDDVPNERVNVTCFEEIIALDERAFGANRTQLIESLIKEYPNKAWIRRGNNSVVAFALGRKGNKYHHIGPVSGSNVDDVKILIKKALNELLQQPVVIDVLNNKEDLITWLKSTGFAPQRQFVRMYKRENPFSGIVSNQYAICGPEFG